MFKQREKKGTRSGSCKALKHVFPKNKGKCLCGNYYKDNGRLYRKKGDRHVAGTTAEFRYKQKKETKRTAKRSLKTLLRK